LFVAIGAVTITCSGCGGDSLCRTKGRVVKGGEGFIPGEGENLQIGLMPIMPDNELPKNYYYADVDQESGTFTAAGPQFRGVPPGKYVVTVELMKKKKDLFEGRYDVEHSPFTVEIEDEAEEIVVELDTPSKTVIEKIITNEGS
jgi:hypothetical protein